MLFNSFFRNVHVTLLCITNMPTMLYTAFIIRLAPRAGRMQPLCPLGTIRCIQQAKFSRKPYNIHVSFIDQVCSVKMAGYWPRSFFASLWTSTSSRSINTQQKNLANTQPSWPNKLGQYTSWKVKFSFRGAGEGGEGVGDSAPSFSIFWTRPCISCNGGSCTAAVYQQKIK